MNLFNVLQPAMFSLLTSKNRDIYVSSLFILRKVFLQEFNIEKDKLIATVASSIENSNYELMDSENEVIDRTQVKDPKSTSAYIIKRFEETGNISLLSLTKIAMALDVTGDIKKIFAEVPYKSIQEVINEQK